MAGQQTDPVTGKTTIDGVKLKLAPSKTDPSGEEGFEVFYPYSDTAEVNACGALLSMMTLTLSATDMRPCEQIPLFCDWRAGKEGKPLTYTVISKELASDLAAAGFDAIAMRPHSLRRGCATALAGIGASEAITKMIGIWATNAWELYAFATDAGPRQAMLQMAEFDATAGRPLRR